MVRLDTVPFKVRVNENKGLYINRSAIYLLPALNLLKERAILDGLVREHILGVSTTENGGIALYVKPFTGLRKLITILQESGDLTRDEILNKNIHVLWFHPDINYNAFLSGEYSKIYDPAQLIKCVNPKSTAYKILTKTNEVEFKQYVSREFNVPESTVVLNDYSEHDIPPFYEQEMYEYDR